MKVIQWHGKWDKYQFGVEITKEKDLIGRGQARIGDFKFIDNGWNTRDSDSPKVKYVYRGVKK